MGSTVYINKERATSLRLVNTTGVALVEDEFTVMRGQGLVALEAIDSLAEGALENVNGCEIQAADFVTGEATFASADLPVYWDPTTKKFSNTSTVGYYLIGYSKAAISGGIMSIVACEPLLIVDGIVTLAAALAAHLADTADAHDASAISLLDSAARFTATEVEAALAELAGASRTTETVKANATAIAALSALAGTPFRKTGTLTSAAGATPVHLLTAAEVGAGKKAYILGAILKVDGATAWTDSTGTIVTLQDDNGTPVVALTYAKAQLTGNAVLVLGSTGVTIGDPVAEGTGLTTAKGIDIVADSDFDAGDDIKVTVFGYIA